MLTIDETDQRTAGTATRKHDFSLSMQTIKLLEHLMEQSQEPEILRIAIKQIRKDDVSALNYELEGLDEPAKPAKPNEPAEPTEPAKLVQNYYTTYIVKLGDQYKVGRTHNLNARYAKYKAEANRRAVDFFEVFTIGGDYEKEFLEELAEFRVGSTEYLTSESIGKITELIAELE